MTRDPDLRSAVSAADAKDMAADRLADTARPGRSDEFPLLLKDVVELLIDRVIESGSRQASPGQARDRAGAGQ